MATDDQGPCEACGRDQARTFHHLIPRSQHHRKWFKARFTRDEMGAGVMVCRDCHSAFHQFLSEKELGRDFHTLEALLGHPQIGRYVRWVSGQRGRHRTRT
jgi:hypothetical protein